MNDNRNYEIMNDNIPCINRIQNMLMLRSKFVSDAGLLKGKTGIVLAYAHLYAYTHNDVYYDCMSELLDDVLDNIHKRMGVGFMSGLSGIGWGIEYLLQNHFVEGEGIEVCEDIDREIMAFDPRRISDLSLENGLEGLLHYVLIHIRGNNGALPFDEMYLSDLYGRVKALISDRKETSVNQLGNIYMDWYEKRLVPDYQIDIMQFVCSPEIELSSLSSSELGIREGVAGLLLKQVLI